MNLEQLRTLPAASVDCVVTSPPYWGLRDYGVEGQGGLEETPEKHVEWIVAVFAEVARVLKPTGTAWVNYGDCYASGQKGSGGSGKSTLGPNRDLQNIDFQKMKPRKFSHGLKPKDLVGMPWRVAFGLQADGWYLRSDIIWHKCLSGGTRLYARTQKGDGPHTVKDLVRLDPSTVQLWNGERWTRVVSWTETLRPDDPVELVFRSGERVGCTGDHRWPTQRGNVEARDLVVGDVVETTRLPEPAEPRRPAALDDEEIGWLVGLYFAEGSRGKGGQVVQFAGHVEELERFQRLDRIARAFDSTCRCHVTSENGCTINVHGMLGSVIDRYVHGSTASTKGLKAAAWQRSDAFLAAVLLGYLDGDGCYDEANDRWRLGFTRNDRLAADLRTLAARVGARLRLVPTVAEAFGREWPVYRGELRWSVSEHHNVTENGDVVEIRRSRARKFWDVAVEDEPHTFALASGLLTHNSNPMPESVTDRPTKSHEYVFLLAHPESGGSYYYDADAIREAHTMRPQRRPSGRPEDSIPRPGQPKQSWSTAKREHKAADGNPAGRNLRDVWTIPTQPYAGAHFATFPEALVEPCVKAGCPEGGTVLDPFAGSGTTLLVAMRLGCRGIGIELNPEYAALACRRIGAEAAQVRLF